MQPEGADAAYLQEFPASDPGAQAFAATLQVQHATDVLLQDADDCMRRKDLRLKLKTATDHKSDSFCQDWQRGQSGSLLTAIVCPDQGMDTIEQLRPPAAGT